MSFSFVVVSNAIASPLSLSRLITFTFNAKRESSDEMAVWDDLRDAPVTVKVSLH
jgi:hypothetical protein